MLKKKPKLMEMNFIIVNKITKDKNGNIDAQPERVRINEIKSYRKWYKTKDEEMVFKGQDITCLYMYKKLDDGNVDKDEKNVATVKVLESVKSLDDRLGVIQLK